MFQIQCPSGHNENADFYCLADNCKDNRFHCFNQCIKNDHKHVHNNQQLFKIEEFSNYLKETNIQLQGMIKELDTIFEDVYYLFTQTKQHLQNIFGWTLDRIKCLKGNNINIALDNMIKFEEYRKRFIMNINQNIKYSGIITIDEKHFLIKILNLISSVKEKGLFQFYPVNQCQIKEKYVCSTIALNQDSSIIICGFHDFLKIYEFKNQSFQQIQIIYDAHLLNLLFINDTDRFITINYSIFFISSIDIFQKSQNQWQRQTSIQIDINFNFLFIMKDESFILLNTKISWFKESLFMTIWQKTNEEQWIREGNLSLEFKECVFQNADMNDSENTIIISCQQIIQIIQRQYQTKKWNILQKIKTQEQKPQAKFIQNNQFISLEHTQLCIYTQISNYEGFEKTREVNFQFGTMISKNIIIIQFIKIKQILLVSINQKLNIIRVDENGDLKIEYCFEDLKQQGMISKNGKILVAQDLDSKQISIRQLQE